MNFIFERKKYFTRSLRSLMQSFFHEKINFVCSNQCVILFYYIDMSVSKIKKQLDEKQRNDDSDIFTSEDMENMLVSRM